MRIVSEVIARPIEACWRAFTDHASMPRWVPGLQAAELVEFDIAGLPHEVRFGYAAGLAYSLHYTYDTNAHVVRWEPVETDEDRGGVRGFARFEPVEGGTRFTYALEHDQGRKAAERALDNPQTLVEAFARWMHEERDGA
jgi:uncharacterized protein YndB with AHSA1/START domain